MSCEKDNENKENLEKLFLKSNEKNIFAKIQEKHSIKFFLGNLLNDEVFLKNGILEVLPLAIKHNKPYVFNEVWKKISQIKNQDYKKEIYKKILSEVLVECNSESEILKIVSNKIPLSFAEIKIDTFFLAFKQEKEENIIFFFEKRRLKKHADLTENYSQLLAAAHAFNCNKILEYFSKRKIDILGENYSYLKKAAISGQIEKLNYFYNHSPVSFRNVIDWTKESVQPHEISQKWLNSLELKLKLCLKLMQSPPQQETPKKRVNKI